MKKKKKFNPNSTPISLKHIDIEDMAMKATEHMTCRAWLLALGAYADFSEASQKRMLDLCDQVNYYIGNDKSKIDNRPKILSLMQEAGITKPYKELPTDGIKTKGDLDRYIRKVERNALYTSFSYVVEPFVAFKYLPEESLVMLFRKAFDLNEEVITGRITLEDIQGMLEDEYDIQIEFDKGTATIRTIS